MVDYLVSRINIKRAVSLKIYVLCEQVIFQLSLSILDDMSDKLMKCKDDGEAMTMLAEYLDNIANKDSTVPEVRHSNSTATAQSKPKQVFIYLWKAVKDEKWLIETFANFTYY